MQYRSWLIVPGNDLDGLSAAATSGADVVVIDLEDSVALQHKPLARRAAAEWLTVTRRAMHSQNRIGRWVRINPLGSGFSRDDLAAIMAGAPDGIVLPKVGTSDSVRQVAAEIYELEQRHAIPANSTRMVPVLGETPNAALTIPAHLEAGYKRVAGLTWSAAALAGAIGARRVSEAGRGWTDTFRYVRAQTLLAAHAGRYMAIEAAQEKLVDIEELEAAAQAAREDGFAGMFASHPGQVATINAAFAADAGKAHDAGREMIRAEAVIAPEARRGPILRPA